MYPSRHRLHLISVGYSGHLGWYCDFQSTTNDVPSRGVFLACPTGWRVDQRIGWPLHQMHDAVPLWKEKLKRSMERYVELNLGKRRSAGRSVIGRSVRLVGRSPPAEDEVDRKSLVLS
jgi:hypothetical protein